MPMPTTEHTINGAIAARLRQTRRAWQASAVVRSEITGMLKGSARRPDILVLEPNMTPVVMGTELLPVLTVEKETTGRLERQSKADGRRILSGIAVRLPAALASKDGEAPAAAVFESADLDMAMFTGRSGTAFERWPPTGWVRGSVTDLSVLAQSAAPPLEEVEAAAEQLAAGVSETAGLIEGMSASNAGVVHKISQLLLQEDGEQTRRMAATILANAFVFHGSLAAAPAIWWP